MELDMKFDLEMLDLGATEGENILNNKGFTLIELMIVVVILSLLASIAIPNFIKLQDRAKEAKVKGGAHTLQLAAEDYCIRNDGIYSDAVGDVGPLLPMDPLGGNNLQNAFSGNYTEPVWAGLAAAVGEIGIVAIQDAQGTNIGYTITGWGQKDLILTISSGN
jgi:prepilin-type N-terminal cleavage/methylation domain-containing protein